MDNPLKIFTPQEWDQWLTVTMECTSPGNSCAECVYADTAACDKYADQCLFCKAYHENCDECDPDGYEYCRDRHKGKRLDMAINRLEFEDIF